MTGPQHLEGDRNRWAPPLTGQWVISVDYVPVVFDGKTFWIPANVQLTGHKRAKHVPLTNAGI